MFRGYFNQAAEQSRLNLMHIAAAHQRGAHIRVAHTVEDTRRQRVKYRERDTHETRALIPSVKYTARHTGGHNQSIGRCLLNFVMCK